MPSADDVIGELGRRGLAGFDPTDSPACTSVTAGSAPSGALRWSVGTRSGASQRRVNEGYAAVAVGLGRPATPDLTRDCSGRKVQLALRGTERRKAVRDPGSHLAALQPGVFASNAGLAEVRCWRLGGCA
jgi:hypothetical protein